MFRLLILVILVIGAVTAIEARWNRETRALSLRVRDEKEIVAMLRDRALSLGERAVKAASEVGAEAVVTGSGTAPAHVGAARQQGLDRLTPEDRRALDRLIEEKMREKAGGAPARAN